MPAGNYCKLLFYALILAQAIPFAYAQTTTPIPESGQETLASEVKKPEFDVATVKKSTYQNGSRIMNTLDGFSCDNIPLKSLITGAYPINGDLIFGGPAWADTMGFDVNAKILGVDKETLKKMPWKERQAMMRALLADRFKLKVHIETKVLPIYELVVMNGGMKLKALPPVDKDAEEAKTPDQKRRVGATQTGFGTYKGQGVTIGSLAVNLQFIVHRTVTDKTGLTGIYDIDLKWTPEDEDEAKDSGTDAGPSIFTALQEQLGLKLQPSKGPVDTLVIDHAELPTEN
jgi:uncharacterized protein (TIGR03435 family)